MSKFDGLFPGAGGAGKSKNSAKGGRKIKPPVDVQHTNTPRRGRPAGKRSDPDYVGFTTYIRKATHKQVKRALLEGDEDRELSELVEALLVGWLKTRG